MKKPLPRGAARAEIHTMRNFCNSKPSGQPIAFLKKLSASAVPAQTVSTVHCGAQPILSFTFIVTNVPDSIITGRSSDSDYPQTVVSDSCGRLRAFPVIRPVTYAQTEEYLLIITAAGPCIKLPYYPRLRG